MGHLMQIEILLEYSKHDEAIKTLRELTSRVDEKRPEAYLRTFGLYMRQAKVHKTCMRPDESTRTYMLAVELCE